LQHPSRQYRSTAVPQYRSTAVPQYRSTAEEKTQDRSTTAPQLFLGFRGEISKSLVENMIFVIVSVFSLQNEIFRDFLSFIFFIWWGAFRVADCCTFQPGNATYCFSAGTKFSLLEPKNGKVWAILGKKWKMLVIFGQKWSTLAFCRA
jgi:hypothetical protein